MKPIIVDMKDMSDSTEVYGSRPHPFFIIFIYLILALVIASLLWMSIFKIDIVVKSNGMFRLEENEIYISSTSTGKVKECKLEEGKFVNEGDVLLSVEHEEADKNLKLYEDSLTDITDRLAVMKAYVKYIDGDSTELNMLAENKNYDEFVNRGKIININNDVTMSNSSSQILQYQQSIATINTSIEYYQRQIDNYNKALGNIKSRENTFDNNEIYYYVMVNNYIEAYNMLAGEYDENSNTTAAEKKAALDKLQLEQISSIEQQKETANGTMLTLKGNLENASAQLLSAQNGTEKMTSEIALLSEKSTVNSEILTYESKKTECENNIATLKESISKCEMKASTAGYISIQTDLKMGNYVQEGTVICQIIPEVTQSYSAEIYVSNKDIGKISEGQQVKFEIAAYPSSEYGYFTGTVEVISKDVKVDSSSGSAYYLVKVKCQDKTLHSKNGSSVEIMNGMACQAKIITDEQSVLEYVLREIDLWWD